MNREEMLETIERAVRAAEWPRCVKLAERVKADLMLPRNVQFLIEAYGWAWHLLNYTPLLPQETYPHLLKAILAMYSNEKGE
jgi:hypothetical protein